MIMGRLIWICVAFYLPFVLDVNSSYFDAKKIAQITDNDPSTKASIIFLLRHAEKVDDSRDPALSPAGEQRAELLANMLKDLDVTQIHTTDYKRTRDTVAPLAKAHGLSPETYDPRALQSFAEKLKHTHGVQVVVGHSNTTPELVEQLGGNPGEPIVEANEYDRLYMITLVDGALVNSMILRFGPSNR